MHRVIDLILVFLLVVGCSSNSENSENDTTNGITITGTVSYPQTGEIVLEKYEKNRPVPFDTFKLDENYAFNKRVNVTEPGYYRFNFYNIQFVNVILDKDDINIRVDGNNRAGFSEVSGSSDHDLIARVQKINAEFQSSPQMQEINQKYSVAMNSGDTEAANAAMDDYMDYHKQVKEQVTQLIDSVGATLGVIEVLKNGRILDKDESHKLYVRIAEDAKVKLANSPIAQEFVNQVELSKQLSIGMVAPEIALPNPDGEVVPLSSLRGKYVLVDFWAKWCGPCRKENPNVVRMYNKYNEKGFEVYGVSLDRRKEDWLLAIEQDGLHWTQVSDLKYWQSEAALTYNVSAIPFALLLDPDGKIIGKNLRGRALEKKLEELFGEG